MVFWLARGVVRQTSGRPAHAHAAASVPGDDEVTAGVDSVWYTVIEEQAALAERDREEEAAAGGAGGLAMDMDEDDLVPPSQANSGSDAAERASLETFERYIRGMLTSHESMTLERLHAMLRMVASGGGANEVKFDMNLVQVCKALAGPLSRPLSRPLSNLYIS